jgi:hypothetical protein
LDPLGDLRHRRTLTTSVGGLDSRVAWRDHDSGVVERHFEPPKRREGAPNGSGDMVFAATSQIEHRLKALPAPQPRSPSRECRNRRSVAIISRWLAPCNDRSDDPEALESFGTCSK